MLQQASCLLSLKTLTLPFKGKRRRIEVAYLKNREVQNLKLHVIWTIERKGLDITLHANLSFCKHTLKLHLFCWQLFLGVIKDVGYSEITKIGNIGNLGNIVNSINV